jgi:hypoxanthine phosphoribosyltransferase
MKRNRPGRAIISERRLRDRVRALGRTIRADYRGSVLMLVAILKGSFIFMADLSRAIGLPLTCDFLAVSSYGSGTTSNGRVKIDRGLDRPIRGKHVLVVEDIVDTGATLARVVGELRRRRPASLRLAVLFRKPARERVAVPIDYLGFTIPDRFVVGYGLDHDGRHRNLPYLAALDS